MLSKSKIIVITGGSSGIGYELALFFSEDNHRVIIIDLYKPRKINNNIFFLKFNLKNFKNIQSVYSQIKNKFGEVDVLINNARGGVKKEFLHENYSNFENTFNIILSSHFFLSQFLIKNKKNKNYLTIINISSVASKMISSESAAYHLAKSGLEQMTKYFAYNSIKKKVKVFSLMPALIIQKRHYKKFFSGKNIKYRSIAKIYQNYGKFGEVKDIYSLTNFLIDDSSAFLNGNSFTLDGGSSLVEPFSLLLKKNF
jgi:NAD(P)-dependent dehydrogenase (short-subunit alcohol dehydrogenase family)